MAKEIVERPATERGKDLEEAAERMLTAEAVLELVQRRGYEHLASGELMPSVRDTVQAALSLRELEKEAVGGFDAVTALAEIDLCLQIIREEVTQSQRERILARIEAFRDGTTPPQPVETHGTWDTIHGEIGD